METKNIKLTYNREDVDVSWGVVGIGLGLVLVNNNYSASEFRLDSESGEITITYSKKEFNLS